MKKFLFSILVEFVLFWLVVFAPVLYANQDHIEKAPAIHIKNLRHQFPTVFEGEILSHAFEVYNNGPGNLVIQKIRHS